MKEDIYSGTVKAGGAFSIGEYNAIRLLVTLDNETDFTYLYIPACNYKFQKNDEVSWDNSGHMFCHSNGRSTEFNLLNVALRIQ
jgi:hypothetical protein